MHINGREIPDRDDGINNCGSCTLPAARMTGPQRTPRISVPRMKNILFQQSVRERLIYWRQVSLKKTFSQFLFACRIVVGGQDANSAGEKKMQHEIENFQNEEYLEALQLAIALGEL